MTARLPDDFGEIRDWYDNDAPDWIRELLDDWMIGMETGWILDDQGIREIDEWETVRIDADGPDEWSVTITYEDGTSETIDFEGRWEAAWGMYDLADARDDLEAERGDIEY
jgi:hypothetical protein